MVGNRIKLIRLANSLSLQELAEMLETSGVQAGKASLSNYENGLTTPPDNVLSAIAHRLGSSRDFFDQPDWTDFSTMEFTPKQETPQKVKNSMDAFIQIELEKYSMLDSVTFHDYCFEIPSKKRITIEDSKNVEQIAEDFRAKSELGTAPIASVCGVLESCGWRLLEVQNGLPYVCGYEQSKSIGYILYPALFALDDLRLEMLKAVGYSLIEGETPEHTEILVTRFASAVLIPGKAIRKELGTKQREIISTQELSIIKQKYGISRRALKQRLFDLDMISQNCYEEIEGNLRIGGYPRRKQLTTENLKFFECPTLLKQRIMEAVSFGVISKEIASPYLE